MKRMIIGFILVIIVALSVIFIFFGNKTGTLEFSVTPIDVELLVDGKKTSSDTSTIKLSVGDHIITAKKDGYLNQEKTISIKQNSVQKVAIKLFKNDTRGSTEKIVTQYLHDKNSSDSIVNSLTVTSVRDFYDGSWVVAYITSDVGPARVILKQSGTNNNYDIYMGPGTYFDDSVLAKLPSDVRAEVSKVPSDD